MWLTWGWIIAQATGQAICGSPAANDSALVVRFFNGNNGFLVTGGQYNLRVW